MRHAGAQVGHPPPRPESDPPHDVGSVPRVHQRRQLGSAGEKAAAELLTRRGYEVVGAGFTARRGEIDLLCRRGDDMVVVEVKTRTTDAFGTPLESVGARKRRALKAAAAEYRALADWRGRIRFAVVGLTGDPVSGFKAELVEDPFE
ncbi:MAG: YraN family protein [Chloroflexi bacterium]|nr:MAG: YraN family protein [Chloroflexota bacterium]TMF05867.1 MAG: YraN family protein [Chloroflexota bacterium]TMG31097.1 MAG: YraN family protein [Chloroflexota bacterium]